LESNKCWWFYLLFWKADDGINERTGKKPMGFMKEPPKELVFSMEDV
jgi:hypothetical protein